jgi:hypothetical protein
MTTRADVNVCHIAGGIPPDGGTAFPDLIE